jgi:hypothetical protein
MGEMEVSPLDPPHAGGNLDPDQDQREKRICARNLSRQESKPLLRSAHPQGLPRTGGIEKCRFCGLTKRKKGRSRALFSSALVRTVLGGRRLRNPPFPSRTGEGGGRCGSRAEAGKQAAPRAVGPAALPASVLMSWGSSLAHILGQGCPSKLLYGQIWGF